MDKHDSRKPTERMAAGVKTALLVCVIGFIALMANRTLVAPGGVSPIDVPAAPSLMAPDPRTPTLLPSEDVAIATSRAPVDADAERYDGGDNHPPTF